MKKFTRIKDDDIIIINDKAYRGFEIDYIAKCWEQGKMTEFIRQLKLLMKGKK